MAAKGQQNVFGDKIHSFRDLPETPPAHVWAFKALRNQLLGTRPSPLVTGETFEDDIEEVSNSLIVPNSLEQISLTAQGSPLSPSKAGILKTPGTLSRRKSVTFNKSSTTESEPTTTAEPVKETPKEKRTSILSRNFPGKYPSPYTPRTRQSTPELSSFVHRPENDETDLITVSRSAMEGLTAHLELVLENNGRLQQIITSGELTYKSPYSAHPDLETMKRELEREKEVLKGLFLDFEQQQSAMTKRERELNIQHSVLRQQMEEQYALQSSTAKIVEDYSQIIQELNQSITEQRERYERELNAVQAKSDEFEDKMHALEAELDEAKDLLRGNRQEIESRDYLIADLQEKVKRTQRQLAQLKMETLEARVGPPLKEGVADGEFGNHFKHRRTTSKRSVSATYPSTSAFNTKQYENLQQNLPEALISPKPAGISPLISESNDR
jgi:methyl-accepting chemotaxis protein